MMERVEIKPGTPTRLRQGQSLTVYLETLMQEFAVIGKKLNELNRRYPIVTEEQDLPQNVQELVL
jgi:hypothetical protein